VNLLEPIYLFSVVSPQLPSYSLIWLIACLVKVSWTSLLSSEPYQFWGRHPPSTGRFRPVPPLGPCVPTQGWGMRRSRWQPLRVQRRVARWGERLLPTSAARRCARVGGLCGTTPRFQHCLLQHVSIHVPQPQSEPGSAPPVPFLPPAMHGR